MVTGKDACAKGGQIVARSTPAPLVRHTTARPAWVNARHARVDDAHGLCAGMARKYRADYAEQHGRENTEDKPIGMSGPRRYTPCGCADMQIADMSCVRDGRFGVVIKDQHWTAWQSARTPRPGRGVTSLRRIDLIDPAGTRVPERIGVRHVWLDV